GLDPAGREELVEVLREVHALGATLLLAADRPAEALAGLCDQVLALEGGRVAWHGPLAELPPECGGPTPSTASPAANSESGAEDGADPAAEHAELPAGGWVG